MKLLFCMSEEWAVNLSKLSNNDIADRPELKDVEATVVFREAVLQKVCFFIVAAGRTMLRTVYRGPRKGGFSVVESKIVSAEGNRQYRGVLLTREEVPSPSSGFAPMKIPPGGGAFAISH
ncbi:hypothetical protein ACFLQ0_01335 [Nitrospinota bacterium]